MKVLKVERRIKQLETLLSANTARNEKIEAKIRILKKELYALDPSRKPPSGWILPVVMKFINILKAKAMETMTYLLQIDAYNTIPEDGETDSEDSDDEQSVLDVDADLDPLTKLASESDGTLDRDEQQLTDPVDVDCADLALDRELPVPDSAANVFPENFTRHGVSEVSTFIRSPEHSLVDSAEDDWSEIEI